MTLLDLPNEVICIIARYLPTQRDVVSLMKAHRCFNNLSPILECLYNLTRKTRRKETLLWASIHGNLELARAMLRLRGKASWYSKEGYKDPLIRAARAGHISIVKLLLEHDPSIVHGKRWFDEALTSAVFSGRVDILNLLLRFLTPVPKHIRDLEEYGDHWDFRRLTVLDVALSYGREEIVHILLADSRFSLGHRSLDSAARGGNEDLVRLCLRKALPQSRYDDGSPLCSAATAGHLAIVKLLLEEGNEDPKGAGSFGQTPLYCAALSGSAAIVQLLLDMSGVEPDGRNKDKATPFSAAAMLNHLEVMQLLLSTEKVDIEALDYNRRTPLSLAAGNGHSDAVSFLLGTGAVDPDSKDKDGQTPLSWAAESGHVDVVKLLLATGQVAPDTPADNGKTALSHAAYRLPYISSTNGYEETRAKERLALEEIRRLLKGQAPLVPSIAASTRKEAPKSLPKSDPLGVMEELLKRNDVNPNSQDEAGETPLMFAVQRKHVDAVRILMETGKMKLNLRDEDGWTVFSYAQGAPKPIKLTKAQLDEAAWDTWEATL